MRHHPVCASSPSHPSPITMETSSTFSIKPSMLTATGSSGKRGSYLSKNGYFWYSLSSCKRYFKNKNKWNSFLTNFQNNTNCLPCGKYYNNWYRTLSPKDFCALGWIHHQLRRIEINNKVQGFQARKNSRPVLTPLLSTIAGEVHSLVYIVVQQIFGGA